MGDVVDCNQAEAGCALLSEIPDFSLPLNFGVSRIVLQFHSCIVAGWFL